MIPETMGKYRVVAPLGQGRVGIVYCALNQETGERTALKLLPADHFRDAAARERFLKEARATKQLTHPNLRRFHEAGESGDYLFLALECVDGTTLRNLLVGGAVAAETALAWGTEVADALAAAHAAGIVHGRLMPGKVFISEQGTVKLLDPGLWRPEVPSGVDLSQEDQLTESGLPASEVETLAPEQIRGAEPDPRSDIFALGVLLYEMTTGRHPFANPDPVQTMHWVLRRTPEPPSQLNPQVPAALDAVLAQALAKEPAGRFGSASELAAALRAVAPGEPLPAEVTPVAVEQAARHALRPYWLAIGALLLLLALWFAYLALRS